MFASSGLFRSKEEQLLINLDIPFREVTMAESLEKHLYAEEIFAITFSTGVEKYLFYGIVLFFRTYHLCGENKK